MLVPSESVDYIRRTVTTESFVTFEGLRPSGGVILAVGFERAEPYTLFVLNTNQFRLKSYSAKDVLGSFVIPKYII